MSPVILWFRRDLRLSDNPALEAALRAGVPVVPVYILDETQAVRAPGAASLWWLDKSLASLQAALEGCGSRLVLRRGPADAVLKDLLAETGARAVYYNALFDPGLAARDQDLARGLKGQGIEVHRFNGGHLLPPDSVRTKVGGAFSVFTPFWRAARAQLTLPAAIPAPTALPAPEVWPRSETLADWKLHPTRPDWSAGFSGWSPGESQAQALLADFVDTRLARYSHDRDRPGVEGTSRLSAHLHFGEISPKACWRAAEGAGFRGAAPDTEVDKFLAELGWREFNAQIANRAGDLAQDNFDPRFDGFGWHEDAAGFEAWCRGQTGYPIVDAGMRQLWTTGWMHNRVRMICASFLTKHLLVDWRRGEQWFWDTLVDADHASNAGNWQWVAGTGADAAPYFRIFSPMAQGTRFDPDGTYIRRWVPELARLPGKLIHAPWLVPSDTLRAAGLRLGTDYPRPVVDHDTARHRALGAYGDLKSKT